MFALETKYRNPAIYGFSILFILINSLVIYYFGFLYLSFLPLVFLVFVIGLISYDKLFFLIAFFTPLSLSLNYFFAQSSINLSLFSEPLLFLLLLIIFYKFLVYHHINLEILKHPISIAIIFNLVWMLVTTLNSSFPFVSIKYLISRIWFVVPMYFFGIIIFKDNKSIKSFLWAYGIALFIVFIYTTLRISETSFFAKNATHFAVKPFYNDHTAYGAVLALFTPVFFGLAFKANVNVYKKLIALVFAGAFLIGVFFSYSRAAWVGLAFALFVLIIVKLKIKFKFLLSIFLLISVFIFSFWFQILNGLEKNNQDSSTSFAKHIYSITNVSTDASNLERLNRWYCAIEMFKQKPLLGWGPGTFQFQYAPFQLERMKTIISTDFGDVGSSHSEYLGPLAEQGLIGFLSVIWIAIAIIISGLKTYKNSVDKETKMLALSITLGFFTYFIHGIMNNFLETDKLAVPFFAFAAIIVSIDLRNKKLGI